MKEDFQGQIADVAAGTVDLSEGQVMTVTGLTTAHGKINMLAEAFQKQREHTQVGTGPRSRMCTCVLTHCCENQLSCGHDVVHAAICFILPLK